MVMDVNDRQQALLAPLLRNLAPGRLDRMLLEASIERLGADRVIFEEGSAPQSLHLLLGGSVEAYTTAGGRHCTILIFSKSDVLMPAAAIVEEPQLVSARTLKPSKLLLIPAAAVREEMADCPIFACRIASLLAGQFRVGLRHLKDLKTRTGPQRLAAYLLRLIDESEVAGTAELPLRKGTLASRLCMTPETMSRSLQVVAEHGILVRGHRVILKDRERVETFCRPDPLIDGGESKVHVSAW